MLDVIMPVWAIDPETVNITENAIKSLGEDVRLILIDNGSPFGGGALREWADIYIRNLNNLGYAKAVNQGLKLAGDVVAIANNDVRVSPNWQEVASEVLNNRRVGSVHFRMLPYDEPFTYGDKTWPSGRERWCTSSFFVVRNKQLYDEKFLNSLDDWDYWHRFRRKGYLTAYTNKACYQHMDSFTQLKSPSREKNDKLNREYYIKKWGMLPETQFEELYPGELAKPWKPMP